MRRDRGGAQLAMTRAYSLQRAAPVTAVANLGVVFTYVLVIAATALLTADGR